MPAYYNEFDPKAAAWLRELMKDGLIAQGEVDERSIADVDASDLKGFTQVHFFAGIGGWSYALRLVGWPDDRTVWTGSCPCQPFSAAGKREGYSDERDLWPDLLRLIAACRPEVVFGEQVASSEVVGTQLEASFLVAVQAGNFSRANLLAKRLAASRSFHFHPRWVTRVRSGLAAQDYSLRWKVLGAHSVGAPHMRQRLYWVADARQQPLRDDEPGGKPCSNSIRSQRRSQALGESGRHGGVSDKLANSGRERLRGEPVRLRKQGADSEDAQVTRCGTDGSLADPDGGNTGDGDLQRSGQHGQRPEDGGSSLGMGDSERNRRQQSAGEVRGRESESTSDGENHWNDSRLIQCRDGKARRVPIESGLFPLAHGLSHRVGLLRGAGNAIVPQAAAAFIEAYRSLTETDFQRSA